LEGIKVVTFNNLIIRIFKSHGFEINSSSDYSKYILASKDNINLSIGYLEPGEEIAVAKIRNFYRDAKKDNADRFIYIIPNANYPNNIINLLMIEEFKSGTGKDSSASLVERFYPRPKI